MKHYPQAFLSLCALAGLLAQAPAHAQNIVLDPGFESADAGAFGTLIYTAPSFIGDGVWQVTSGQIAVQNNNYNAARQSHSGNQFVFLTPNSTVYTMSQALITTSGTRYNMSFFAASDDPNNTFAVTFDGVAVAGIPAALPDTSSGGGLLLSAAYRKYTATGLLATGSSTALAFSATSFGTTLLDDVSVTASRTSVPEPSSVALLVGLGVTGTSFAFRRRKAVCKAA